MPNKPDEAAFLAAKDAERRRVVTNIPKVRAVLEHCARDYTASPFTDTSRAWQTWVHNIGYFLDGPGEEVDHAVLRDVATLPVDASPDAIETVVRRFRMGGMHQLDISLLAVVKRVRMAAKTVADADGAA